jgi:hypothetical protein
MEVSPMKRPWTTLLAVTASSVLFTFLLALRGGADEQARPAEQLPPPLPAPQVAVPAQALPSPYFAPDAAQYFDPIPEGQIRATTEFWVPQPAPTVEPGDEPPTTTEAIQTPNLNGAYETIVQLRQLFGDPLAGTVLEGAEGSDVNQFSAALEHVVSSEPPATCMLPSSAAMAMSRSEMAPTGGPLQTSALRDAARSLDQTANDLEEQALYAEADELRAVATRLRLRARLSP